LPGGHERHLSADAAKAFCESFVESQTGCLRQGGGLGVAENFNRLLAGVYDDPTILALAKMLFNRGAQDGVERFVQIIRELADNRFALH
jgi:hypothetical protein